MTRLDVHGYFWLDMAMTRVKIAELKDQLSRHLRSVEAGAEITVTDRDRPIARILPMTSTGRSVVLLHPARDIAEERDRERVQVHWPVSSTELLLEERRER